LAEKFYAGKSKSASVSRKNEINSESSKSDLKLIICCIIQELEGKVDVALDAYSQSGLKRYCRMVEKIREKFNMSSLKYNTLIRLLRLSDYRRKKDVHIVLMCQVIFDIELKV
jgi:hypothetical protein